MHPLQTMLIEKKEKKKSKLLNYFSEIKGNENFDFPH